MTRVAMSVRPTLLRTSLPLEEEIALANMVSHARRMTTPEVAAVLNVSQSTAARRRKSARAWKISEMGRLAKWYGVVPSRLLDAEPIEVPL